MEETKKTVPYNMLSMLWNNEKTGSYSGRDGHGLNPLMRDQLELIIKAGIEFTKTDFDVIFNTFRGAWWFGANPNGNGCGDFLYRAACQYNISAAISYEAFFMRTPFIIKGTKRAHIRSAWTYNGRYYTVTGWSKDQSILQAVSYDKGWDKGIRKLHKCTREEWLKNRKNFRFYN